MLTIMSFDAHSLERLKQLGRALPQPLPLPQPKPAPGHTTSERRHQVETEEDPAELFRQLMRVSPDGTVPPHLMDRLRQMEEKTSSNPEPVKADALDDNRRVRSSGQQRQGRQGKQRGKTTEKAGRHEAELKSQNQELYAAFQQLLLEDDDG
ncbi:hypothetical protein [Synechococcus sp. CBW1107]|uniref:hypothetical protein n=1 Tax=Synechococcus sp. CBW1107 TaxID=2789857 RepID=UPI002AD2C0B7|nr:hypothetical protein [Synechococcus sp. CBW1107]CAK6695494.1 hypothetical protein IFHNHDMJ_01835 [Synechococcus sp. CBW1107]